MPRYVILRHELPTGHGLPGERSAHWDLMFECDGKLRTWALEHEPAPGSSCVAEALADHRLAYLDYEGEVSGNRGHVKRWDAGHYELLDESDSTLHLTLTGDRMSAGVELKKEIARESASAGYFWRVSFSALPTRG